MNILTFDLETTGFDPSENGIIEVGFAVHNAKGDQVAQSGTLVQSGYSIPEEVQKLTGISTRDVQKKGHPWPKVRDRFADVIQACDAYCAYNSDFDVGFLDTHMNLEASSIEPMLDPYHLAQHFLPARELSDKTLEDVAGYYGVSLQNAHRAEEDASATATLLFAILDEYSLVPSDVIDGIPRLGPHHYGEDPIESLYSGLNDRR